MRDYGKIYSRYWRNNDILHTSDADKLLGVYLLTSSHTNLIGCCHLPTGYITSDLNWDEQKVLTLFDKQIQREFIIRCKKTSWILINNYLKYNPIQNQNQGTAAYRLLLDVPDDFIGKPTLLELLHPFQAKLPDTFIPYYKQHSKCHKSTIQTDSKPIIQEAVIPSDNFEKFWQLQIRKEKKLKAEEIWTKLGLNTAHDKAERIIECWLDQKQNRRQYQDKTKTPLPFNWLAGEQWEDEFIRFEDSLATPTHEYLKIKPQKSAQSSVETHNRNVAQHWAEIIVGEKSNELK